MPTKEKESVSSDLNPQDMKDILSTDNRENIVSRLDSFLTADGMGFYEGLLGFADLFNSIFVTSMSEDLTEEEKVASNERINNIREKFTDILNNSDKGFLMEDVLIFLNFLTEATILSISADITQKENA